MNHNINQIIQQIIELCEKETPVIITELQQERFGHQGAFNGHEKWKDNSLLVQKDKGINQPLVDSGNLEKQLSTASNWDLQPKMSGNTLKLTVPKTENFTDAKYDILDSGGKTSPYLSPRGNWMSINSVPVRPFKDLSDQDADWIVKKLVQSIIGEFA